MAARQIQSHPSTSTPKGTTMTYSRYLFLTVGIFFFATIALA